MSSLSPSVIVQPGRRTVVNTEVLEIELDIETSAALGEAMEAGVSSPYVDAERAIREATRIFHARVPDNVLAAIERFMLDPSSLSGLHFANLPIDRNLSPTPRDGQRVSEKLTFGSEGVLMGLGRVLGHPYAFKDEKQGQIVQQICPVPKSEHKLSNEGSLTGLGMHVENSFSEFRPHYVLLLCLRGDRDHRAVTRIAAGDAIASRLSPAHLATCRRAEFRIQCPESFQSTAGQKVYSDPIAIFSGPSECEELQIDLPEYMQFLTDGAAAAYAAILEALEEPGAVQSIDLQPGQALILANRRITHGRTVFSPYYDGADRWLQRMFVTSDLWPMRAQVDHRLRVI